MRVTTVMPALVGALLLGACNDLTVGDLNNPGLESLQNSPTRTGVLTIATGLQVGSRFGIGNQNGYVVLLGILGREVYNIDPADPRFVSEMLVGPLDGGSPAFGGNLFQQYYSNIRTANILIKAMNNLSNDPQQGMTTEEKEATLGYAQTMQAYDFLRVINTRDDNGAPVDVDIDPTGPPAPIKTKAEVFTHIVNLLDSAQTHLQAGGATFPFGMSPGFAGFDSPATFIQFNRALRARVAVYLNDWAGALTALGGSFITTDPTKLDLGVYHTFSITAGDSVNSLVDPIGRAIIAHPALATDAQLKPGGQPDDRLTRKTAVVSPAISAAGLSSDRVMSVYTSPSDPVPIIRNEELLLLRAEANIGLNTPASLAAALADINIVRQASGGLAPLGAFADQASALNELLYNKRYSLLFEGGHRWLDLRHYGRLTDLPQETTNFGQATRIPKFPFPSNECLAQTTPPATGCSPQAGS